MPPSAVSADAAGRGVASATSVARSPSATDERRRRTLKGTGHPSWSSHLRPTGRDMTRRFTLFVALVAGILGVLPGLGGVARADYGNPAAQGPLRTITFPVIGTVSFSDDFRAPRSGHLHEGNDIMGKKMMPEVAAVNGTVTYLTIPQASYGYSLTITGDDGWSYHYLHINNDTPGTDDGKAELKDVFAPGIRKGGRVNAGQIVAFLGDSGNAETTGPHLHFELHDPTGA